MPACSHLKSVQPSWPQQHFLPPCSLIWHCAHAVLVHVDKDLETAECDICSVTGVELSAAPRRPANQRTIIRKTEWIPYGENLDDDAEREMYFKLLNGYTRDRVGAAVDAAYPEGTGLPPHLLKVRAATGFSSCNPCHFKNVPVKETHRRRAPCNGSLLMAVH